MRKLQVGSSLYELAHKRVVNSAYFSPLSGSKILTTAQDNRIRVWDSIFGDMECPSREIVHSHDFNRHLTPFRAEWDPKVANIDPNLQYYKYLIYVHWCVLCDDCSYLACRIHLSHSQLLDVT